MSNAAVEEASADAPSEVEHLRARVIELEKLLLQKSDELQAAFRMPPMLTNLLGLLVAMPYVDAKIAEERAGIVSNLKVTMHRLRMELKGHGIEIRSRKQAGYWLDDADKTRIRELIELRTTH
jgi:hypothetical protein